MFSILTPTYNRAHTLDRVLNSLINQTDKDFQWIIIDDCSTDSTASLVSRWQKQDLSFELIYRVLPENKGKPNALNVGLEYCSREITVIADSDDEFIPETIKELKQLWSTVNLSDQASKIATIWTLVKDEDGKLVGESFPNNFWQVDLKNRILNRRSEIKGEKWHSWRTNVLKDYGMFHSENSFITESCTWNRINKDYDFLCINIYHRTYFYSEDGYIQSKKSRLYLEKLKFHNSYYHLFKTRPLHIVKYPYYHSFAFDYIKSKFTYRDDNLKIGFVKTLLCACIFIIHLPKRLIQFIKLKNN